MSHSLKFWDKLSKKYDRRARDITFERIIEQTLPYLHSEAIALDIGCATGLYSFEFADKVNTIFAFDTSFKMISFALDKADNIKSENLNFFQTTLFDKRFTPNSFDIIFAFNVLLYFENLEECICRIEELLKPDGVLLTSTACLGEKKSIKGVFFANAIKILKKLKILPYLRFFEICELEKIITDSGLTLVDSKVILKSPVIEHFVVAKKSPKISYS